MIKHLNLLIVNETNDRLLRSSSQYKRLTVLFVRLQTFTAFSVMAPRLWNSIPNYINKAVHLIFLKLTLKHFYLKLLILVKFLVLILIYSSIFYHVLCKAPQKQCNSGVIQINNLNLNLKWSPSYHCKAYILSISSLSISFHINLVLRAQS